MDPTVARSRAALTQSSSLAQNPQINLVFPLSSMVAVVENQQTAPRALLVEALPARQEEDFSGLEAGSATEPAASLLWTEVDGHEEPPLTLSTAHLQAWGKGHGAAAPEGGHLGTARGTKEGIHNSFESPRALGPLKSPLEVDDFKETGRDKSLINTAPQAKASKGPGRSWQLASAPRQSALWSGDH